MNQKIFMLLLSSFILLAYSCNRHQPEVAKEIDPVSQDVLKSIQTAHVDSEEMGNVLRLNGKIQPNEEKQAKVFSLVSGRIQSVDVELGDYVKHGQVLAVLKSAEVAGMTNDLAMAESNVELTKKSLEATKDLYEGKLATKLDYTNAEISYNKALSELDHAKQVSSITGGSHSAYTISAPINGFVIEKNITGNSEVRADNSINLFSIADLSNVWIMANVYESDLNKVHLGDTVIVNTLVSPEKDYLGRIDRIYNILDPANRTMKIRVSMDNPFNELKPEMFVTVKVKGKATGHALVIPSQAIVMDNSKNYVVVKKSNNLRIQEITLLKRIDNKAYITGLSLGDEVVTNSQVFLYQALNTK